MITTKYLIDGVEVTEDEFRSKLEEAVEYEFDYDSYDDLLDDAYPEVTIGNMHFNPSQILKECDPTAYHIGYSEELDNLLQDKLYELEYHSEPITVDGIEFEIVEEDDEDDDE